jgi:hypothetical protein
VALHELPVDLHPEPGPLADVNVAVAHLDALSKEPVPDRVARRVAVRLSLSLEVIK